MSINLIEIMEKFPDQQSCIAHLEQTRWGDQPKCPHCESESRLGSRSYKFILENCLETEFFGKTWFLADN